MVPAAPSRALPCLVQDLRRQAAENPVAGSAAPHTHCLIPNFQGAAAATLCRAATPLRACKWKSGPGIFAALTPRPTRSPSVPRPSAPSSQHPNHRRPAPPSGSISRSNPPGPVGCVSTYNRGSSPDNSTALVPFPPDTITMMHVPRQPFSTAARIHPNIVPHLRPRRRMPTGWVKPVAAVVVVGYGVKTYLDMAQNRRQAQIEYMEREAASHKQRNEMLMDMYGDRSSLDELEKAIEFYEKR
ncbi:hypothetical protein G7Z17_g10295 [Cylindrodendrum hubeiense]|uniref:Uncharacterized protein n=1 Tax=Cylindrodendrum hubeiense TaxID=595255 RepID=A0A9P5GZS5_9HYPO|nr:hypothetical protein G7Z17_g10295 [Cylindrodendrum hubeiense]